MSAIRRFACLLVLGLGLAGQAFAQAPARKPVVAVVTIKDPTSSGQADTLKTMMQTAVTETGKFRVIERDFGELDAEQALARSRRVTTDRPGRSGGYEGVDFLIYGTITSASGGRETDEGANAGRVLLGSVFGVPLGGGCNKAVATVAVDVKIVDTLTGEAKFAKQITERASSGTACGGAANLDLTSLIRNVANETATGLAITMYPIKVAAVLPDGVFMLNYGEGALSVGTILAIYGQGIPIPDPDTGVMLTTEGAEVGRVRVTEVTTRFSKAMPITPFASTPPAGAVARVLADQSGKNGKKH
ncbi:MAG: hypothetical protein KGN34_16755 [Sphingomonadales bacterium]|nr:hypothetical protein [Sphingomonadales bacterium]